MNLLNPVLSFLFPAYCGNCSRLVESRHDVPACERCWSETRIFDGTGTSCRKCGKPHSNIAKGPDTYCRECDDDSYDLARSSGLYQKALRATVLSLKNQPYLAKRAGDLLFDCYVREPFRSTELIIPIPLSKRRLYERGFNQAEVIARAISSRARIPVDASSLIRTKHSKASRAALDRKGRRLTVLNAFSVRRNKLIRGKNIMIVDDVFTSGATVSMAAKALKKNGAARVDVLTLARAGRASFSS